jgi:hypothetical protein
LVFKKLYIENDKAEIIERFNNRDIVKVYFDLLNQKQHNSKEFSDIIQGISNEVITDLNDLFNIYGIKPIFLESPLSINHSTWWYDCLPLEDEDLDFFLPLFFKEFSLYPISLIKNSQLKNVYFVNSLIFSTHAFSQYRASVPDYSDDVMSMIYCCKERGVDYIKNVIHHEFFHFVDFIEDKKIYGPDPDWEILNEPDFKYGSGGAMNREWKPLSPEIRGFLNFYSTTGIEEDKAEIFSHMINFPEIVVETKCEILKGKFDYIRNLLERFDPDGIGKKDFWETLLLYRLN